MLVHAIFCNLIHNTMRRLLLACLLLPALAVAAPQPPAASLSPSPKAAMQLIKQDANLYRVDSKLYRSEQLNRDDLAAIRQLGIRSVVNLRYFGRHKNQKIFAGHPDIALINRPLLTWRVQPRDIARVLRTIEQQQQRGAVLVHCYHGADRTGTIVAMYRIVYHGLPIADALAEMKHERFGYHSIWRNLERLFTEENVAQVKAELARLRGGE